MKRLSVDFMDMCEFCVMFPKAEGLVIKQLLQNMCAETNVVQGLPYTALANEMSVTEECVQDAIKIGERENILIAVGNTVMFNPDFVYVSGLKRSTRDVLRKVYLHHLHNKLY